MGSSQGDMPYERHWLGLISYLTILSPNRIPCPNNNMYTLSVSIVHMIAAVHISKLSVAVYLGRKGETEHIKSDQLSGLKIFPKQCVCMVINLSIKRIFKYVITFKSCLASSCNFIWSQANTGTSWDEATPTWGPVEIRGVDDSAITRTDNLIQ